MTITLRDAALSYAEDFGWSVFPCRVRAKEPFGALAPRGVLDATDAADKIRAWWKLAPHANIGLPCSSMLVVDVDPRNGGDASLTALEEQHGELPDTLVQLTPSGGRHIVFELPPEVPRWRKSIGAGLDIKAGASAYILAAPSVHPHGGRYRWRQARIAEPPAWLAAMAIRFERQVQPGDVDAADSVLAFAFEAAGLVRRRIDRVRIAVECPWESEHSTPSSETSAVVFAPRSGSAQGWFHCSHAACEHRTMPDVFAALGPDALRAAAVAMAMRAAEFVRDGS